MLFGRFRDPATRRATQPRRQKGLCPRGAAGQKQAQGRALAHAGPQQARPQERKNLLHEAPGGLDPLGPFLLDEPPLEHEPQDDQKTGGDGPFRRLVRSFMGDTPPNIHASLFSDFQR